MNQTHSYAAGDKVKIWVGDHQGEMTVGTVVHVFYPAGGGPRLHVVEVETGMDAIYECRTGDPLYMRPTTPLKSRGDGRPRLRRAPTAGESFVWRCSGRNCTSYGDTPRDAFLRWAEKWARGSYDLADAVYP